MLWNLFGFFFVGFGGYIIGSLAMDEKPKAKEAIIAGFLSLALVLLLSLLAGFGG